MKVRILWLCGFVLMAGCTAKYVQQHVHEGDNTANYKEVFGTAPPQGITILNSIVLTYSCARPLACLGMIMTHDFEFEFLAPREWLMQQMESGEMPLWGLHPVDSSLSKRELSYRLENRYRPWYVPKRIEEYELYRDYTSAGFVQLQIHKEMVGERCHVFISKH